MPKVLMPMPSNCFNWVDVNAVRPLEAPSDYRSELGLRADSKVVLFSGTWGAKQDLLLIPEVARQLQHRSDIAS